jgi:type II secretory pathway component GspD/PulD (secretin)
MIAKGWMYRRIGLAALAALLACPASDASDGPQPADESAGILLNFPENMELKVLVDYVSQRLGLNILYDEQIGNRLVTIKAPTTIPDNSLLGLLESALRMKGLALIDAGQPGWKRIAPAPNLAAIAKPAEGLAGQPVDLTIPTQVLTRVFPLRHSDAKRVEQIVKPFLTEPGANATAVPESRLIIVTDYASNMARLEELIRRVDQPGEQTTVRFVPVRYQSASQLAPRTLKLVQAMYLAETPGVAAGARMEGFDIAHDEYSNQVVVVGPTRWVDEAVRIIQGLDVSLGVETKAYQFKVISPQRVDRLIRDLMGTQEGGRFYRSAIDQDSGLLIVTATPEIHTRIGALMADLDVPAPASQSPIQVYKLINTTAADVLETIRALESEPQAAPSVEEPSKPEPGAQATPPSGARPAEMTPLPPPPAASSALTPYRLQEPPAAQAEKPAEAAPDEKTTGPASLRTQRAMVTADQNTNSIIVVAAPEVQAIYENLIKMLDIRRPQVLIEVTIVTIDTSDDFSLGVELSRRTSADDGQVLTFSSFGLSTVNPSTAALTLLPGRGFTGALVGSDVANVIIRALSTHTRAKVVSAPKLLVNDNATGTLSSVEEEPYTSVNASETVSTTSFGGFVSAGTEISVTPHISLGDHLGLEYSVALNSFTGTGSDGIPPPRQTNKVESEVTIPDGYTIIVGGLNRKNLTSDIDSVPFLDRIPLLKHLFSNQRDEDSISTLFVFIRPVILRDDRFADLKFHSERDLTSAGMPSNYPISEPMVVH